VNTYFKAPHDESHRVTTESGVQFRHLSKCSNTRVGACVRLRTDLVAPHRRELAERGHQRLQLPCVGVDFVESADDTGDISGNGVLEPVVDVAADPIGDLGGVADEAARVLLLWGRRPPDPSPICSKVGPEALGRVRSLLSGY